MEKKRKFKYIWDDKMIDLGLRGNEILVYAVISSHSQNKQGIYYGDYAYLAEVTGASIRAIKGIIERLSSAGLIEKECLHKEGAIIKNALSAASAEIAPVSECRNCTRASAEIAPVASAEIAPDTYFKDNNINTLSTEVERERVREKNYTQIMVEKYGCDAADVETWISNRIADKGKKGCLTDKTFSYFLGEVEKAGITVAEAVHMVAGMGWYGFRAEYARNSKNKEYGRKTDDRLHTAKYGAFGAEGDTCDF